MFFDDFYIGMTPPTNPVYCGNFMNFMCKTASENIPVYVPCLIRNEKREQFQWWWGGQYYPIPDNKILDTGIDEDFKQFYSIESLCHIHFSSASFGGYESYDSEKSADYRNGVPAIIPKGSSIWYNENKTFYISNRLIMDFNEKHTMTLDEAIEHCKNKEKLQIGQCAIEHKQLRLWLEELKSYKMNDKLK